MEGFFFWSFYLLSFLIYLYDISKQGLRKQEGSKLKIYKLI